VQGQGQGQTKERRNEKENPKKENVRVRNVKKYFYSSANVRIVFVRDGKTVGFLLSVCVCGGGGAPPYQTTPPPSRHLRF